MGHLLAAGRLKTNMARSSSWVRGAGYKHQRATSTAPLRAQTSDWSLEQTCQVKSGPARSTKSPLTAQRRSRTESPGRRNRRSFWSAHPSTVVPVLRSLRTRCAGGVMRCASGARRADAVLVDPFWVSVISADVNAEAARRGRAIGARIGSWDPGGRTTANGMMGDCAVV